MTHRSDRDALIKEAAKAIKEADNGFSGLDSDDPKYSYPDEDARWLRALAEAALSVFEKTHTPTDGSCWVAAPKIIRNGVHDPMPTLCELTAGHLGAHRSGQTEWMHSRPAAQQGEPPNAQVNAAAKAIAAYQGTRYDGSFRQDWDNMAHAALRAASAVTEQGENRDV